MKNLLLSLALTLSAGAAPAAAADALGTLAGLAPSADAVARIPGSGAPVDVKIFLLVLDRNGDRFNYESSCRSEGEVAARVIAKAGFQVLSQRARPWRDGAGNEYWEYAIEYSAQPGMFTPDLKTSNLALNKDGYWYGDRYEAEAAGRERESRLAEAGYYVVAGWPRKIDYPSAHWEYYVMYTAKAGRAAADSQIYLLEFDRDGTRFDSAPFASSRADDIEKKLAAAGLFTLQKRRGEQQIGGRRYWEYRIEFIPRAGRAQAEVQTYITHTDEDNGAFGMDFLAGIAGESATSALETAGYVVLQGYLMNWDGAWKYKNVYVAPSGYTASPVEKYLLAKDGDGQPFTSEYRAKDAGRAMAATLKAAGYAVLQGVTRPHLAQPGAWLHEIDYIRSAK